MQGCVVRGDVGGGAATAFEDGYEGFGGGVVVFGKVVYWLDAGAITSGDEGGYQSLQAAGRMRVMQARVIKDELAWAAVIWKVAS